jgi:competence protein ComEC
MTSFCLCILLGAYLLLAMSQVPAVTLLPAFAVLAVVMTTFRQIRQCGALLCGFCMMWWAADTGLDDRLDPALAGATLPLVGRVLDFPESSGGTLKFVFAPIDRSDLPAKVRLNWFEAKYRPAPGETWHFDVRLRRPRGLANPAGFDFSGWLFRQGIGATGYVMDPGDNRRLLTHRPDLWSRVRTRVAQRVSGVLPDDRATAVLLAIAVGARQQITRDDWDQYAATGTSHLMAISGLHIGLAAGSFFMLGWVLLAPFCRHRNVRDIATILAVIAATVYGQLSGFAVPAQRAFLMVAIVATGLYFRRRLHVPTLLAIPCLLIFFANPLAILSPGFKLSFAAVAIIFFCQTVFMRRKRSAGINPVMHLRVHGRRLLQIQLALLTGLFPFSVILFDRFAISAPLVNTLALPLFNFIVVPACLLGMLCDGPLEFIGDSLLRWSYAAIELLLCLIEWVATQSYTQMQTTALSGLMMLVALLPVLHVVLPAGWPGRRLSLLAMLAVVLYKPPAPPPGCFEYTVLDVGQGLSVLVRTNTRALLFDTGPSFRGGNDVAQLVVVPHLRRRGIDKLDTVIVSHADADHAGGLQTVIDNVPVGQVLSGERVEPLAFGSRPCRAGLTWRWDDVDFSVLHPLNRAAWSGNNLSCLLLISAGRRSLLLTGDIEVPVEILLAYRNALPHVAAVIVPHHGSGTSSSNALIEALRADLAIVSAGFDNRWNMPKEDVVRRWQVSGATVLNTASSGAVSQRLCRGQSASAPAGQRSTWPRLWHDGMTPAS